MYLEKAIFVNRAPFDKLELDFFANEIAVLSAVNGRGKTTIISYIVDAIYEMARPNFVNEFEGKENKFYRVSSPVFTLDATLPSFIYLRFKSSDGAVDYLDARGGCTEEQYNSAIALENKIPFHDFQPSLVENGFSKTISSTFDRKKAETIFSTNLLTYFPSYRFEQPGYLNNPYRVELEFKKQSGFSGRLRNPIEVYTSLPQLANWFMDVILDLRLEEAQGGSRILFENLSTIVSASLAAKNLGRLRLGVGPRGLGGTRIQILEVDGKKQTIYPTIFNLSSGESSLLCLFGEILRQADNIKNNVTLPEVSGIVLIDEIDKHLHISIQKEVLPILLNLFPRVQFIVSSHSPFLSMGLADEAIERSRIIDLDTFGISKDPATSELYVEVYNMMVGENERFKNMYQLLVSKLNNSTRPLIVTEGKTDIKHLKKAMSVLDNANCDVEFYEITEDWGDSKLTALLAQLSKVPQQRKVIGIFDRDVHSVVAEIEKDGIPFKDFGNNVFAFCIPVPQGRELERPISIEFYYSDQELKKQKNGKCIYFDNEVAVVRPASNGKVKTLIKLPIARAEEEAKKKIFDEDVGEADWIHSKAVFADLVASDVDFAQGFNFNSFAVIFDRIRMILQHAN